MSTHRLLTLAIAISVLLNAGLGWGLLDSRSEIVRLRADNDDTNAALKEMPIHFKEGLYDHYKDHNNEKDAKIIAEKIKEVKLKEVITNIMIDFGSKKIKIGVDPKRLKSAHIGLDKAVEVLNEKGFDSKKLSDGITLNMEKEDFKEIYKTKEKIKEVILTGIKSIAQQW